MISQDVMMERLKRSVRVIKDAPQYMLADNVPGNLIAALLPDTQLVNNLSPTIQELGKKLLQAAQDGDVEEIRKLLAKGAPFTADWLGTSPLHLAAQNNHLEVCEIFLRAGMCKDTRTKVERTPLHMAAYEGNYDIVECLLKHGADADAKDMLHMTPLHWAAQNGHAEIAASLIRNGASTDVHNKFDLTPMDIALQTDRPDIVEVINFTIRDPLQATNHLVEMNESNDAVEPILHLNLQAEAVHSPAPSGLPIETVLMEGDSNDYLHHAQVTIDEPQQEIDEVQYTEDHTATFNESMKLLQQHGITMLPDDDDTTILSSVMESGHSVVLTEAGKQALNSIKQAEKNDGHELTITKRPNILQPAAFKKKKIITVTADQFLAMTANNTNTLRIVNGKLVQTKATPIKRIIPKAKVSPVQNSRQMTTAPALVMQTPAKHEVSETELELMQQLTKARALAEAYKKRLVKTEQELHKYKQKCKLLMGQNNL